MQIRFTKMHGLGNDFVVINTITQPIELSKEQIRFIADRHFGVGCDQLLLVESSDREDADFRYRIYNADGDEVEQCGNGARCFAIFVRSEGLTDKTLIPVVTNTGLIKLQIEENDNVMVNMAAPVLLPKDIPFVASKQKTKYHLELNDQTVSLSAVSMGNPHAVILVDDVEHAQVESIGKQVQENKHFPNSANVGFMQVVDPKNIKLRVYERGVGETQACGTGACAAVVAGRLQGLLNDPVTVELLGGKLSIHWAGGDNPVMMTGETATVFKGVMTLNA